MSSTDYDVFFSHNSADKPAVEELARSLSFFLSSLLSLGVKSTIDLYYFFL